MGSKYLGQEFDIHGGGMDLMFPHHESEIAQGCAAHGKMPAKYWLHNNMVTINGQKMGKSLGNAIALEEFFTGKHALLEQAYNPMVIRFFMLQAHYRSTLDFSNEALQASEKGLARIFEAKKFVDTLQARSLSEAEMNEMPIYQKVTDALSDDFNTPIAIAHIFDAVKKINLVKDGKISLSEEEKSEMKEIFDVILPDVLGLTEENSAEGEKTKNLTDNVIKMILEIRQQAKNDKNWAASDAIRNKLTEIGVNVKDSKDGAEFSY
jgi:cysteinyl-tRNA synthetase